MSDTVEVIVGVVGRAHGIKGEIGIDVRTDEPERRFVPGAVLRREGGGAELVVESARDHSGRLLIRFLGYPDRTAVEHPAGNGAGGRRRRRRSDPTTTRSTTTAS